MAKLSIAVLLLALTLMGVVACGGGKASGGIATDANGLPLSTSQGTINIALTDAPACGFAQVNITLHGLRVHPSETASIKSAGWIEVPMNPGRQINLLDFQNGKLLPLGSVQLPAGQYAQIHLMLAENGLAGSGSEMANNVVREADGRTISLQTIAAQRGLSATFAVAGDRTTELTIDLDACGSIVESAQTGEYFLYPKLAVITEDRQGKLEIAGELGMEAAGTVVSAQVQAADGRPQVVKSTVADALGFYLLSPLPASPGGRFNLIFDRRDKPLHIVTDVPAVVGAMTRLPAIDFHDAGQEGLATGLVLGSVSLPQGVADAVSISAIHMHDQLEFVIGSTNADANDQTYALSLPASSPFIAPFSADALSFAESAAPSQGPGAAAILVQAHAYGGAMQAPFKAIPAKDVGKAVQLDFEFALVD